MLITVLTKPTQSRAEEERTGEENTAATPVG